MSGSDDFRPGAAPISLVVGVDEGLGCAVFGVYEDDVGGVAARGVDGEEDDGFATPVRAGGDLRERVDDGALEEEEVAGGEGFGVVGGVHPEGAGAGEDVEELVGVLVVVGRRGGVDAEDPGAGVRKIPFSRVLYIEADDFMKDPAKKFFRLSPGNEVRLRYAYILKCERVVTDPSGTPMELKCTIDTESLNGSTAARRVKGTIHWVSAAHAVDAEVRLYDRLFRSADPGDSGRDPLADLNTESLTVLTACKVESMLANAAPGTRFQFERQGYFCVDPDSRDGAPVFNRTVTLKDTWAKISGKIAK